MGIDIIPPTPESYSMSDPPIIRPMSELQPTGRVGQVYGGWGHHGVEMVAEADLTIPTHHDAEHPYYAVSLEWVRDWSWTYSDNGGHNFFGPGSSLHSGFPESENQIWEGPRTPMTLSDLGGPGDGTLIGPNATYYTFELTGEPPCDMLFATGYTGRRITSPNPIGPPVDPPASMGPAGTPPNYEQGEGDFDPSGWPNWYINGFTWATYDIIDPDIPLQDGGTCSYPAHYTDLPTPIPRPFNGTDGWLLPVNFIPRLYWRVIAKVPELWVSAAWAQITPYYWREDVQVPGQITAGAATSGTRRRRGPIIGGQR